MTSFTTSAVRKLTTLETAANTFRSQLLYTIGIAASSQHTKSGMSVKGHSDCHGNINLFSEPLKTGLGSDDDSSIGSEDDIETYHSDDIDQVFNVDQFHRSAKRSFDCEQQSCSTPHMKGVSFDHSLPTLDSSDVSSHSTSVTSDSTTSLPSKKRRRKRNRVALHESVAVIPIPSRSEYSNQARERLWSSSAEICANAARNSVEFESEGWNWRTVIEDEHMLVHKASGELIHPIHIHNALACMAQEENSPDNHKLDLIPKPQPQVKKPTHNNTTDERNLLLRRVFSNKDEDGCRI